MNTFQKLINSLTFFSSLIFITNSVATVSQANIGETKQTCQYIYNKQTGLQDVFHPETPSFIAQKILRTKGYVYSPNEEKRDAQKPLFEIELYRQLANGPYMGYVFLSLRDQANHKEYYAQYHLPWAPLANLADLPSCDELMAKY